VENQLESRGKERRWIAFVSAVVFGSALYAALSGIAPQNSLIEELIAQIDYRVLQPLYNVTVYWLLTIEFGAGLAAVFALQILMPARPGEKIFSSHVLADGVWFFYANVMNAFVETTYVVWVSVVLGPYLSSLRLTSLETWPVGCRFLVVLLFIDLMRWLLHYAEHKVPIFWQFHAVHHSQTELSFFTDFRVHFFEYLLRSTFIVIPLLIVDVDLPAIVGYAIFERWYTHFYHSNLKLNFGPLKYILVTPQSHRLHHIQDASLRDMNFGHYLVVWDWIFATQSTAWDTYAPTGIEDASFPLERDRPSIRLLWLPLVQQIYPVKVLALTAWRRLRGDAHDCCRP
jgi:sterol desaturase/sphingolipid hydroxylase (fatty acid hydroxylase superfamily)